MLFGGLIESGLLNNSKEAVRSIWDSILEFWGNIIDPILDTCPLFLFAITRFVLAVAALNVIAAFVCAIIHCYNMRLPNNDSGLMLGYCSGTGQYQRKQIYKKPRSLAEDHTWSAISLAGLAYRIGRSTMKSHFLMFSCSLIYLPLAVLGFFEMIIRDLVGFVFTVAMGLIHWFVLVIIRLITTLLLRPLLIIVDKALSNEQHCPECFASFDYPLYICPRCGSLHKELLPGNSGLFFARCVCGERLPVSVISGRSKLHTKCPKCTELLATESTKQFSINLIGGNSSGKTAFLASFAHNYIIETGTVPRLFIYGRPKQRFADLENYYLSGQTASSSSTVTCAYTFIHRLRGKDRHSLIVYDMPDEIFKTGEYDRNPLNLGYADGVLLIIDPLGIPSVREKCREYMPLSTSSKECYDDPEIIVEEFIRLLSGIIGRTSERIIDIPIAVVINKADIKPIRWEIGRPKIHSIFSSNPERYGNDLSKAQDEICREYLSKHGLSNALSNLESVFSSVRYFPASATGQYLLGSSSFHPFGVIDPIAWLVKETGSPLTRFFAAVDEK